MNKKQNKIAIRQAAEKAVIRDELNKSILLAATKPVREVMKKIGTSLTGLDEKTVSENRTSFGSNKVTREKKKSLPQRLAESFINPFTAILFCLAIVSSITDMLFPYFSLFGSTPEDFDCLTVVIIMTMVIMARSFSAALPLRDS